jgi:hypothetical protein
MRLTGIGAPVHRASAARWAGHPRLQHAADKAAGHGGIHRITACAQHVRSGLGGLAVLRRNNPEISFYHVFADHQ